MVTVCIDPEDDDRSDVMWERLQYLENEDILVFDEPHGS